MTTSGEALPPGLSLPGNSGQPQSVLGTSAPKFGAGARWELQENVLDLSVLGITAGKTWMGMGLT